METKLYVGNLSYSTTETSLQDLFSAAGTVKSVQPFITGFLNNNDYWGRPVDVQFIKDGSMLISDDYAGAVYRVTYSPQIASR